MISIAGAKNSFRQRNLTVIEIVFYILTIIVLFIQINEYIPTEPLIVLEVEALKTSSAYSLTGSASNQDYLLEYIKIYPHSKVPIKQASFQYDHYKKNVNLKKSQIEEPTAYIISKELLQQAYGKESFRFNFLENDRFKFNFEFDQKVEKLKFECQVVTVKQRVPCEVVEKGFLLSSWYAIMVNYSFYALIITVIVVFWFFRYNKRKEEIGGHFPNDEGILKPEK